MLRFAQIFLFALMLMSMPMVYGQTEILVDQFSLFEEEGEVSLTWVVKAGSICNGIEVERSLDGINFNPIGRIAGVCGNLDSPVRFDYVDDAPVLSRVNYYRLYSGNYIISEVIDIEVIELGNGGYVVKPNPVVGTSKLYFDNPRNEVHQLTLIDQRGNQVRTQETFLEHFSLEGDQLAPGMYFFQIRKKESLVSITGRLIIAH